MKEFKKYPVTEYKNFRELLDGCTTQYKERPLFRTTTGGSVQDVSCNAFILTVERLGAAFGALGLLDGSRIAVVGETSVKWIATYFAAVCGGAVIVPVDKELPVDEMANILRDSGAKALVYSSAMCREAEILEKSVSDLQYLIGMDEREDGPNYRSFDRLIQSIPDKAAAEYKTIPQNEETLSTILYTSGTTGQSKGVMLCPRNILSVTAGGLTLLDIGDVCLSVLPIHHSLEFSHGIVMMMQNGTTISIGRGLRYFMEDMLLFQPNAAFLVPAFVEHMERLVWKKAQAAGKEEALRALMAKSAAEREKGHDLRKEYFGEINKIFGGRLELLLCGGAHLPAETMKRFRDWGIPLVNGYGLTECSPLVAVNGNRYYKDGSVGLPIPCNEVEIRNIDGNGEGEIWVRGENVMLGYYHNEEATAQAIRDNWFDTGDLGHLDQDGYLFITGRKKNLIVFSNGKNIYPEEIEEYFKGIEYLKEIVVFARENDEQKDQLCAEVFLDEAFRQNMGDEEALSRLQEDMAKINKSLPVYKQVRNVVLRDAMFEKTTKNSIKRSS
ncbi:long-chain-fatty-acid--CoA ligase [Christensenellaceae bacterium]|nr:long-chain-fatty-acid--CoA ligase [Christensenellaceae bacterium]BDF61932.1 long-chain-fatty-acid--CoA ligase [Christensenellaceae bacterium]